MRLATVHTVEDFLARLGGDIEGVEIYGDRSLHREDVGLAVVAEDPTGEIASYVEEYLRPRGQAPDEVMQVHINGHDSFFGAIKSDSAIMRRLREFLSGSDTGIEAFNSNPDFECLVQRLRAMDPGTPMLGIPMSPPEKVARVLDHKVLARKLARDLGSEAVMTYAEHELAFDYDEARLQIWGCLKKYGRVMAKAGTFASGIGQLDVELNVPDEKIDAFLRRFMDPHEGLVVEQHVGKHFAGSVQWEFASEGYFRVFLSRQLLISHPETKGGVHVGNVIADKGGEIFPQDWPELCGHVAAEEAWHIHWCELNWAQQHGYVGRLGADFMVVLREIRGKVVPVVYKCEFGGRVTGGTYINGVRVRANAHRPGTCVVGLNCEFNHDYYRGWRDVSAVLEATHLDDRDDVSMRPGSGRGVLVGLTRGLPRKCILFACADSVPEAWEMQRVARKRLGATLYEIDSESI
ncbi:MAG: hypothetical protein ABIA47_01625 [bacterium]